MFGFFIIIKLFDISCISDHVQPISKPLSVVLAACGHFVVTWSVQEYSCGHIGLNKTKHRIRISTLNSLLTVQFYVPQKCCQFKPNTELLKTCKRYEHTLVCYFSCLLFGFCLDFLLPKILDNTGE